MPSLRISNIFIHVFAAVAFMSLPLLFMSGQDGNDVVSIALSAGYWMFCFTYIFIFYLNTYYLIPKLYFKKKYLFYIAAVLLMFALVSYYRPFELLLRHHHHAHPSPPPPDMFSNDRAMYDQPGSPPRKPGPRSMRIDIISIVRNSKEYTAAILYPWQKLNPFRTGKYNYRAV